jgi:hypothetical protein
MRQLVCMSADVYCQNLNNWQHIETSYLYSNGKKGKHARCRRDRERESVCERQSSAENRGGVRCKKNGHWGATNYFGIILRSRHKDYIAMRNYSNGRERLQRYIKIIKIE